MKNYYDNDVVETVQPVNDNKRKFTIKIYKSDGITETLENVKKIVIDVDKTNGTTIVDMLDPDYTELKERIEKLENRSIFKRIFRRKH
jgi:hypothetical protein